MNERLYKFMKHPATIPIGIYLVSFSTGVWVGFLLGRRNRYELVLHDEPGQLKFDLDAASFKRFDETEEESEVYSEEDEQKERGFDIATPAEAFILEHLPDTVVLETEPETEPQSIFSETTDNWNYEEELEGRDETHPYVLHTDEFFANEKGYVQKQLTYYAGDNITSDEEGHPVYNHQVVLGALLFGHGSGDQNIFYVRNDQRKEEYEIIFDDGHFSVEVMGLQIEDNERVKNLKHDRYRKFRPE